MQDDVGVRIWTDKDEWSVSRPTQLNLICDVKSRLQVEGRRTGRKLETPSYTLK